MLASFGHVRDLAEKEGSVDPDDGFAMTWQVDARAKKRIDAIAGAARQAGSLFLATDPDREGEAIFLACAGTAPAEARAERP